MPKRADLKKIMVIGSGPIVIGQAAEFDYAGTRPTGESLRAFFMISRSSSGVSAKPPPVPPRVKAGRSTTKELT